MSTKMTQAMRKDLTDAIRDRYAAAANNDKRRILDEFIAATGYHEKSAIRVLNSHSGPRVRQRRQRPSIYDEAAQGALIVLWEASDRVCGKRLKALLPILLPALERNGHLKLEEEIRAKILSMSAATIDRLLQMPRRATRSKKVARTVPEPRRRIKMRTFADWNEPLPGSMEMDLVAHCGEVNRGSYVHSLVLTDIASGWTEAAPIVVREGSLVVETLERIRVGLPFTLRALDVDNVLCREAAASIRPADLSAPICWIGASVRLSQVASTVNGIVLSHSKHRIHRRQSRGPHRPQYEIHPRWKAQTLSTGSLARPHGPYRERSFHPAPDAQRTAGILLRL